MNNLSVLFVDLKPCRCKIRSITFGVTTTFTDQAKKELEQVKKQFDMLFQPHRNLLNRQKDIELQIETLAGNEVKNLSGQVENQFNKLSFSKCLQQNRCQLYIHE